MLKKFWYLLPLLAVAFLVACDGGSSSSGDSDWEYKTTYYLTVDNSLDTMVTVTIDSSNMDLYGYTSERIDLEEGTHSLTVKTITDSLVMDTSFTLEGYDTDLILNCTRGTFVKNWSYYSVNGNDAIMDQYTFEIDTFQFEGVRAEVVGGPNELLIPKNWDYNLDIEMPDEVTVYDGNGEFRTKLYRKEIFVISMELLEIFEEIGMNEDEGVDFLEGFLDELEEEAGE